MPRLLVVYQDLPHYRHDVFRALEDADGWKVEFAAGTSCRDPGIPTIEHGALRRAHLLDNRWVGHFLWQSGLLRLLRENWDYVIFFGDYGYLSTWAGALVCRMRHVPVFFWTIGWHRLDSGARRWARLLFYHLADDLLLYGHDAKKFGEALGYPSSRMTVVYNSSSEPPIALEEDAASLDRIRSVLGAVEGPMIGAVIRLTAKKRLHLVIDAAAYIKQHLNRDVSVIFAGDGPEASNLRAHAESLGVKLLLVGPVYGRTALGLFYERCLVTVVPTLAGLTTLQSLKHGRPVVTHDNAEEQVPEYEAIVPGVTGDLYMQGDNVDLALKIVKWLDKVQGDPESVSAACRNTISERWSAEASARRIIGALKRPETRPRGGDVTRANI